MSHANAQIEMHKERLEKLTGMPFLEFMRISDERLLELTLSIPYGDAFEIEHLITRLITLNKEESSKEGVLLTHLVDVLNPGARYE
jgi:hypothetical protein